jgi:hypothetical protein
VRALLFAVASLIVNGCGGGGAGGGDAAPPVDADPAAPDADPSAPDGRPDADLPDADPRAPDAGPDAGPSSGWHPDHLAIGTLYEGDTGADTFFARVAPRFPAGRRLDYAYLYLNGGGQIGEWPRKVGQLVRVLYAMNGDSDSAAAVFANMRDPAYLTTYFRALRDAIDDAGDEQVGFVIEPDMLGYLQQQIAGGFGDDPARIPAATHAAYDSGVLVRGRDPAFADTLPGLVQAINHTIRSRGRKVFLGWQLNLWGAPGAPARGIVHATEELGQTAGLARIRDNARALARFAARSMITADADFVSIDKYGLDGAGAAGANPANPADSYWFCTLRDELDLPMVLWQIPVGRINTTGTPSPTEYNPSGRFPDLDNTSQRFEDSASSYFFGDTFTTSGARLTYFARNDSGDPLISVRGSTVTWGSHMRAAADAGVVAILFGAGVGIATRGVPQPSGPLTDQPTDGYYWITRVQGYYGAPVALP